MGGLRRLVWRLLRQDAGNVLMMTAAFMIPLTALIGSGVDLGRTYVARQRMQVACDSASLAGRRAVAANETASQVSAEAAKFFYYNFPQNAYGTANVTPTTTISTGSTQIVTVKASTTLPMSIMTIFGYSNMPVSVTCNAQENFVNTDVVLVLDVTGSMLCAPNQTTSCPTSENASSKIAGLRSAVLALYDSLASAQTQLQNAGLRLRYALVPFTSTVNIGNAVYGLNPGYIMNPAKYQTQSCVTTGSGYSKKTTCTYSLQPGATHPASWFTNGSWGGCVEEAATVSTITTKSGYSIPSGANDLNIDLVPTTGTSTSAQATQWAPFDPSSESGEGSYGDSVCTAALATPLQAWQRADLVTYLNTLKASGGTMTDEGMIWSGRMLSQTGIWASMNPNTYGNMPVNRYVILMTDGGITAYPGYYAAYGNETLDNRVDGSPYPCANNANIDNDGSCDPDDAIHRQRFSMVCNEIKNESVSIWTIGFGSSFTTGPNAPADLSALQNCASNSGQTADITDSATLISKFTAIGQAIGALRLTQ